MVALPYDTTTFNWGYNPSLKDRKHLSGSVWHSATVRTTASLAGKEHNGERAIRMPAVEVWPGPRLLLLSLHMCVLLAEEREGKEAIGQINQSDMHGQESMR